MANKQLNLDLSKDPLMTTIIYGRVGDDRLQTVTVTVTSRDEAVDLTGYDITFEGTTYKKQSRVFDPDNVSSTAAGLKKGTFDYTFPNMAFAVAGRYERAYFSFVKNDKRDTTGDFEIQVLDSADITADEAEAIITEYNKLVEELKEAQKQAIEEMKKKFGEIQPWIDKINELEALTQKYVDLLNSKKPLTSGDIASEAEAGAGVNKEKLMSPYLTRFAFEKWKTSESDQFFTDITLVDGVPIKKNAMTMRKNGVWVQFYASLSFTEDYTLNSSALLLSFGADAGQGFSPRDGSKQAVPLRNVNISGVKRNVYTAYVDVSLQGVTLLGTDTPTTLIPKGSVIDCSVVYRGA